MSNYGDISNKLHEKLGGKLEVKLKCDIKNKEDMSTVYTPGVASPCLEIKKDQKKSLTMTWRKNLVAVVTDGSAVLGLGNIGGYAAMPVMEGKCCLFKKFAGIDAVPICLETQDTEEIIQTIKNIAPSFGGINLEDIAAPKCFEIEKRLKEELDIPVFHDDQHGTAITTLAALYNALTIVKKDPKEIKIIISGAGAAGIAIAKLLYGAGLINIILCDSKGALSKERKGLNKEKQSALSFTNKENKNGSLKDVMKNTDVFIGVSAPNILNPEDIAKMNKNAIVMAMSNPIPEIMPDKAKEGGAKIVATGRSDFNNQVNNVLVFPGIFKGAFAIGTNNFTEEIMIAAAKGLASLIEEPIEEKILPDIFDERVSNVIAQAVIDSKKDKIKIYGRKTCPYCLLAIDLCRDLKLEFEFLDIKKSEKNYKDLKDLAKKYDHHTVPLIFINNKFIGGYDQLSVFYNKKTNSKNFQGCNIGDNNC